MNTDWLHRKPLFPWLTRRQRLVVAYGVVIVAVILVYTVLYNYGIRK